MRLIDADAMGIGKANPSAFEKAEYAHGWNSAVEIIQNAPTIEAESVKHGRWLKTQEPLGWRDVNCVECSVCHDSWIIDEDYGFDEACAWNYCPNCGAKMDEEDGR